MRTVIIVNKYFFLFLLIILFGCRTADNYKLLSFFFDGVPNPESPKKSTILKNNKKIIKKEPKVIITFKSSHLDYDKRKCYSCHNKSRIGSLKSRKQNLCFQCHKKEKFVGAFIHGPVAVNQCLACHLPHRSKHKKLLIKTGKDLCIKCHISKQEEKSDICNKGNECTNCHNPHFSDNKFFLKINKTLNIKKKLKDIKTYKSINKKYSLLKTFELKDPFRIVCDIKIFNNRKNEKSNI